MTSLLELRTERLKKLEALIKEGINPYPATVHRDVTLSEVKEKFKTFSKRKKPLFLAGRIMRLRGQGGLIFFDIADGTGLFQGLLKKDEAENEVFDRFVNTVDVGDFVEVSGTLFVTKKGEETLLLQTWRMLAKALRPLPEKWHGLKDTEEKFRKRFLDTLMSEESRNRFIIRSHMISALRAILDSAEYLEVETPTLQPLYGGATAEPFTTHHNALDIDLYLRISDELYLKRLLVGNFPKVYEIYKAFRNEGIDVTHYPEFTMVEFYESYSNAVKQMEFVELVLKTIVKNVCKKTSFMFHGQTIECAKPFKRVSYFSILKQYALILNAESATADELTLKARQLGVPTSLGEGKEKILDNIFKKACRPKLIQPTFITEYPLHMLPLAKKKEGSETLVDAFQLAIGGIELAKGFSELNDPIDQRTRFEEQEKKSARGDSEAQKIDEDFLEALEYGMPPAGGVGIGVDRLAMLLTDSHNIKDVILFPTMRQKE